MNPEKNLQDPLPKTPTKKSITFEAAKKELSQYNLVESHSIKDPKSSGTLVTSDKKIKEICIFIAIRGQNFDPHTLIDKFQEQFPNALYILENKPELRNIHNYVHVKSSRAAWAVLENLSYHNPAQKLKIIGVTGTNGKTSTTWLYKELCRHFGIKCMTIGTLGFYTDHQVFANNHTTPDPFELYEKLAYCVENGIENVALEVSSHALIQEKITPIRFEGIAFTSFSQDHLDFHKSMQAYAQAKLKLLANIKQSSQSIAIMSEKAGQALKARRIKYPKTWKQYGFNGLCEFRIFIDDQQEKLKIDNTSIVLDLDKNQKVDYFFENLAAASILFNNVHQTGGNVGTHNLKQIPGRLEQIITAFKAPKVFVDFAHTPDALQQLLTGIANIKQNKIILVFGCGGDRDKDKRPMMGAVAQKMSDYCIITSDNPRNESPKAIIDDILTGFDKKLNSHKIIENRQHAIKTAINLACLEDIVVIAGKGHETTQTIMGASHSFDDRICAYKFLENKWKF